MNNSKLLIILKDVHNQKLSPENALKIILEDKEYPKCDLYEDNHACSLFLKMNNAACIGCFHHLTENT